MANGAQSTSNPRLVPLLIALVAGLAALAYEHMFSRPAVDAAYDAVNKLNEQHNTSSEYRTTTSDDVQKIIGRPPDRRDEHGMYVVEVFGFASGIPFRKHRLYEVYTRGAGNSEGKLLFVKQFKYEIPKEELDGGSPPSGPGDTNLPIGGFESFTGGGPSDGATSTSGRPGEPVTGADTAASDAGKDAPKPVESKLDQPSSGEKKEDAPKEPALDKKDPAPEKKEESKKEESKKEENKGETKEGSDNTGTLEKKE